MAATLLDHLSNERLLLAAWQDVLAAGSDDGPPSAELAAWAEHAASNVATLALQFAERSWKPSPVVYLPLPKVDGSIRKLAIPSIADRVIERALLDVLTPLLDPLLSPWSFGYRRGLGVTDALRALTDARDDGLHHVVRTDIKDCFEQIPRWPVVQALSRRLDDPPVVALIGDLMARRLVGRDAPRLPHGRGLHQGSPLSPLLCNLYLDTFDRAIMAGGWMPIRFGDDIAIPCASRRDAERAIDAVRTALEALELEANLGKTKVLTFDDGVPFLGETIGAQTGRRAEPTAKPLDATVFVTTQGAWLWTRGQRIVVQSGEEVLLRLHPNRVRQVVTVGRVGLTSAFIKRAAQEGIDVVMTDDVAGFDCRVSPPQTRDPRAKIEQYRRLGNETDALEIAIPIVVGKISNMRVSLLRRGSARQPDFDAATEHVELGDDSLREADAMLTLRAQAEAAANRAELMGVEGAATRAYFQFLQDYLPPEWSFRGRARRPPPDPINAMLSFLYTLLTNEAVAAAEAARLDPDIGFLHLPQFGRPSLALDLVEEFRPVLGDAPVLGIVGRKMLTPADFVDTSTQGCRMSDRAKKVLLTAYEQRMLTLVSVPTSERRVSWRMAMYGQARHLADVLRSNGRYQPVHWR